MRCLRKEMERMWGIPTSSSLSCQFSSCGQYSTHQSQVRELLQSRKAKTCTFWNHSVRISGYGYFEHRCCQDYVSGVDLCPFAQIIDPGSNVKQLIWTLAVLHSMRSEWHSGQTRQWGLTTSDGQKSLCIVYDAPTDRSGYNRICSPFNHLSQAQRKQWSHTMCSAVTKKVILRCKNVFLFLQSMRSHRWYWK